MQYRRQIDSNWRFCYNSIIMILGLKRNEIIITHVFN